MKYILLIICLLLPASTLATTSQGVSFAGVSLGTFSITEPVDPPVDWEVALAIAAMSPATWYEIPSSRFIDNTYDWGTTCDGTEFAVAGNPTFNGLGPEGVINGWSGGTYDTTSKRLLLWGGGHSSYGGNEIYAFNMDSAANPFSWEIAAQPSSCADIADYDCANTGYYPDGNPAARHTYDTLSFVPQENWFVSSARPADFCSGVAGAGSQVDVYDFDTSTWTTKDNNTNAWQYGISAAHPTTGNVWVMSSTTPRDLYEMDRTDGSWTYRYNSNPVAFNSFTNGQMAIDPVNNMLVFVGKGNYARFDISDPDNVTLEASSTASLAGSTGPQDVVDSGIPTLTYDSASGKMIGWISGDDVFTLSTLTDVWTRIDGDGSSVPTPESNGVMGRWQNVPSLGVTGLVADSHVNVWIYNYTDGDIVTVCSSGCDYTTIQAGVTAANSGDTVQVSAETFVGAAGRFEISTQANLTVELNKALGGTGDYATIDCDETAIAGKGCVLLRGSAVSGEIILDGLEVTNSGGIIDSAAGIMVDTTAEGSLTIRNSYIHHNAWNGVRAAQTSPAGSGDILIENTKFGYNNIGDIYASGQQHDVYIGARNQATFRYNYFGPGTWWGHHMKSRAATSYILYNTTWDGDTSTDTSSLSAEFGQGGIVYIIGNTFISGPYTDNAYQIGYYLDGPAFNDGPANDPSELYIVNNTFILQQPAAHDWSYVINVDSSWPAATYVMQNNISWYHRDSGYNTWHPSGATDPTTDLNNVKIAVTDPGWTDFANLDFSLTASATTLIDQGTAPGSANGFSLTPVYLPALSDISGTLRSGNATMDIGSYGR